MAAPEKGRRKFLARLTLMIIVLPLLYVLVFELPYVDFLVLNLWIIGVSLFAGREVERFFEARGLATHKWLAPVLGATVPLASYLEVSGLINGRFFPVWLCVLPIIVLLRSLVVKGERHLDRLLEKISSSFFVIIYPGFFLSFVVRMTAMEAASYVLLFFLCMIFTNDILAYLVGRFLARGLLKLAISPNKTLAGFTAGFAGSVIMSCVFHFSFPWLFSRSLGWTLALGVLIGLGTIAGDLIESALKRSAHVKDSGSVMIGRGGLMDSIDSILFCAPLFYLVFRLIR